MRFYAPAGYGNVTESVPPQQDSSKYEQASNQEGEVINTMNEASERKADIPGGKPKTDPGIKEMRKKMRQGDQDAIRDFTAGID